MPSTNLGEEFEKLFYDGSPPPSKSAAALQPEKNPAEEFDMLMRELQAKAAEGGEPVGVASTPVASPAPSIQFAYGNPNGGGKVTPDDGLGCAGAAVIQGSASGGPNAAARPGSVDQPGASAERPAADSKPSPSQTDLNSTTQG